MIRIRFRLRHRHPAMARLVLTLILLLFSLLGGLVLNGARASDVCGEMARNETYGMRQFYVTRHVHWPSEAPTACAKGYHFASIWEIADPSSLKYNAELGLTSDDSGGGPPTAMWFLSSVWPVRGWVRTGSIDSTSSIAGYGNCSAWGSDISSDHGTTVNLVSNWAGGGQDVGAWNAETKACNAVYRVWCVQDDSVFRLYLPLAAR